MTDESFLELTERFSELRSLHQEAETEFRRVKAHPKAHLADDEELERLHDSIKVAGQVLDHPFLQLLTDGVYTKEGEPQPESEIEFIKGIFLETSDRLESHLQYLNQRAGLVRSALERLQEIGNSLDQTDEQ